MNVKINFTRIDFELTLEKLSEPEGFLADFRNFPSCCSSVATIIRLYCLQEPIASSDPSIVRVHLPSLLSHPMVRQELCDKLFAHSEPTYDHLATIVQLIVQVAYHRQQMLKAKNMERIVPSV